MNTKLIPPHEDDELFNELIEMLNSDEATIRRVAISELPEMGDRAVPILVGSLKDSDFDNVQNAAFGLAELGSYAAVRPLLTLYNIGDRATQILIFTALGMIGGETSVQWLLYILNNSRVWGDQVYAALALGEIGDPNAIDSLVAALKRSWRDVRSTAADALGKIADPAAVPALLEVLNEHDWVGNNLRFPYAVTRALAKIGTEEAISALIAALNDKEKSVDKAAAKALERIELPKVQSALKAWKDGQ